jgi:flagellar hook protein FlgE
MIDSIFVALSGMQGHQRGLSIISDNVANMNTPGFRGSSVNFANVFNGAPQNSLPDGRMVGQQAPGGGLLTARPLLDLRAGEAQQTGRDLDLALQGDGFFVLQDENGETRYTRDGSFEFNTDDELVARGQKLKVMARNASGELVPVMLKDLRLNPAKATTEATFDGILSTGNSAGDEDHTIESLDVFDSKGGKHTVKIVFSRDATTLPGDDIVWKMTVSEGGDAIGSGDLKFTGSQPAAQGSPLQVTLALKGADPLEVAFNYDTASVVAIGTTSTLSVKSQDGYAPGTITAEKFDAGGVLKITYSNGQSADGAKLVLAQINDDAGLVELGDALFAYRGVQPVVMREADDDLRVQSQALELSNVDLTQEFSELILMQRGYQASSQVVSTANDMLQELLEMRGRG